jgi:uncharacterized membrane-anchored protein YhcB (DUF1043 family)
MERGAEMLNFVIGLFIGAFIGVCFICLCNATAKTDEQMEKYFKNKK